MRIWSSLWCACVLLCGLVFPQTGVFAQPAHPPGFLYVEGETLMLDGQVLILKGFNYFPRDYGWTSMEDWDWQAVDEELALAEAYGANTIRTGFDYPYLTGDLYCENPFGAYRARPQYLEAIDRFLALADQHHLKVIFWLGAGPCWQMWNPAYIGTVQKHLESLIPRYADDRRIAAWDLATDLDATMLSQAPTGSFGALPYATRDDMLNLLRVMAGSVRALDPNHPITIGFSYPTSALLAQDFCDFLMPQFLGGDAPNLLEEQGPAKIEEYGRFWEAQSNSEAVVEALAAKIDWMQSQLARPMPIVLAEYGIPTAPPLSPQFQEGVYKAVLEMAFLRKHLAGALNWALTDFNWPPKAFTIVEEGGLPSSAEEQSFGVFDIDYLPKPAAETCKAYFADEPQLKLITAADELSFTFSKFFVPGEGDPRSLSVAFDWIEFRDDQEKVLLRLDVGDPAARPYLVEGFYDDEQAWANQAQNFAWANGDVPAARVKILLPPATASIAFRVVTNTDDMRMQVWLEDEPLDEFNIANRWRAIFVNLPEAGSLQAGDQVKLDGEFNLPLSSGLVTLQTSTDGQTWTDAESLAPQRGVFSQKVTLNDAGAQFYRAVWSGDEMYQAVSSEPVQFVVERPPATPAPTLTVTQPPGQTLTITPAPTPGTQSGSLVGLGIGAAAGAILGAGTIALFLWLRRKKGA